MGWAIAGQEIEPRTFRTSKEVWSSDRHSLFVIGESISPDGKYERHIPRAVVKNAPEIPQTSQKITLLYIYRQKSSIYWQRID
jgi:hypothetical protein